MRTSFITTGEKRLNHRLPAMRLWQKAKRYGIWNPNDLVFDQDAEDWKHLDDLEKDVVLRLTTLFQAGEEAVTLDLLPLIMVIAKEGRLEEEMFLTSFLWEEAKHVDGFNRFFSKVCPDAGDLSRYYTPSYHTIFSQELPQVMSALQYDSSPIAQARASVTYNMIVEGVLAETGYHAYYSVLKNMNIFPGMLDFVGKLKQDESRHIAYGVFLLSRLTAEHGETVWKAIEDRMNELLEPAIGVIMEGIGVYEVLPFGLKLEMFLDYAMDQFQKRMDRIEKAKSQTLEEICNISISEL
ncbi:MAG: R2-like ligand-binding oxidase [Sphingobacteriales bacterium]|nr:MAG: R2-like ligand-binding oxidase [Sphingobacteriales bacterium]